VTRAAAILAIVCGCTVSVGDRPDAAPCTPSTEFFVSTMWLGYFDANQCATSNCHAENGGHGYLRFMPPGNMPDPKSPIASWPQAWRDNYYQTIQLVRCDDPLQSRLLTVPEGKADPHPPGVSVLMAPLAEDLFRQWIDAP
jgi:hypothetical protein